MALVTYLDTNCLIALADAEPRRKEKVLDLLDDRRRAFIYSPFTTLETLSLAIHYGKKVKEQVFRQYFNRCLFISDNLNLILQEAQRQAGNYGIASVDACHIAAAVVVSAAEFYTFEKPTKPMFRTREIKVFSLL
ncbi:MAG: PIN domain-containing protein [Acidobacteria bacterium]|nr:PIN domain-containing protein [Acidobacteriota bacterium]MBI3424025.1 PIN domain-containing protein [Acidobacteriota bacterium]